MLTPPWINPKHPCESNRAVDDHSINRQPPASGNRSQSQPQRTEAVRVPTFEFNGATIEFRNQADIESGDKENSCTPKYHLSVRWPCKPSPDNGNGNGD